MEMNEQIMRVFRFCRILLFVLRSLILFTKKGLEKSDGSVQSVLILWKWLVFIDKNRLCLDES